ncbi:MAG: carbamate kinase [Nitrososphaerales archaeon]
MLLALGGNAIMSEHRTFDSQYETVSNATKEIARLVAEGYRIVITHGNGPQVGDTLLRHELAKEIVPPLPLYACVAETQGLLGFMIQTSLLNHLKKIGMRIDVVSMISEVTVFAKDPALKDPTKPVGPTYTKQELNAIMKLNPSITAKEIAPNKYRRVVPSPDPLLVLEANAVKELVKRGSVVIAAGGGGIPVTIERKGMRFIDAVIDKDLASERLATTIKAGKFVSLTDVDGVYVNYKSRDSRLLRKVKVGEMKKLLIKGEFGAGNMEPKVKAAIRFVENVGNEAIIAHLSKIREALNGRSGTIIYQ